ncbi:MAG: hypothetical protein H0W00_01600 [Chloroflexi bacterium]|nr:hypothetical protein [Chloroflexota bacterium]
MPRFDQSPNGADHQSHDRLSVVSLAFGDLPAQERPAAQALRDTCFECAALADEVRLISLAMAQLPAPRRSRDFRLTQEQMQGARGSILRRLLEQLSAPRLGILQPLGAAAMAIGFVFVVVGMGFPGVSGGPTSRDAEVYSAAQPSASADHGRAETVDDTPLPEVAGADSTPGAAAAPVAGAASPDGGTEGSKDPQSGVDSGDGTAAPGTEAPGSGEEPSGGTSAQVDPDRPSGPADPDLPFGEPGVDADDRLGRVESGTPAGAGMVALGLLLGLVGLVAIILRVLSQRITRDPTTR